MKRAFAYFGLAACVVVCMCSCSSGARGTVTASSPSATGSSLSASAHVMSTPSLSSDDPSTSSAIPPSSVDRESAAEGSVQVDGVEDPIGQEADALVVDGNPAQYSYDDLAHDVGVLDENYPAWVHVNSLATTVDGRDLFHIVIGNPDAMNHVLVHAGIHAREYMTTQLTMMQASAFLKHLEAGDTYGTVSYADMIETTAIHVVPCVNPDGMVLSQFGVDGIRDEAICEKLLDIAALDGVEPTYDYFREWKANANGVDLNRNFDALWNTFDGTPHPSTERYKGMAPGSEIESRALIELTDRYRFTRTISYHAMGSVVYWYFGQDGSLFGESQAFAQAIANATGYRLDANYEYLDPAGYKDWALQEKGIPSITIEVGLGSVPLPYEQLQAIWRENEHAWEAMLLSR